MTSSRLDATDLRMALVAINYYLRAHELINKPPPPAAHRLAEHLTSALADNGQACAVTRHTQNTGRGMPKYLTTRQAAQQMGCSERHARRIAQHIGTRIGHQWAIPADAIKETP